MEHISSLFSLLFILAFVIYLFFGIHIFRINPKQGVNRAFLSLSIALCIWSFGYALSNSAPDMDTALFWRRVGTVGRMHLLSIILHFIILLTGGKEELDKKWLLILLHIPSVVLIYVFSISSNMAPFQYNLMEIDYGWLDKPVNSIWNKIHYLYFILYMSIALVVIRRWKKKIKDEEITKRANLIFKTMAMAILFGGLLDILPNLIFTKPVPQLSSVFILLPVGAMYHAARYHDVFQIKTVKKEEIIVTEEEQKNIFTNLAIAICISGILAFVSEYFSDVSDSRGDLKISLIKGGILIALGISIFFIQGIKKESLKETLTTVVLVSSIPIVTFQFLNYSAITVWVFPIIIIISSLVFNKRIMLISTTIVGIITQRLVWIFRPESYVLVDKYDFILRIMAFIVVFLLGSYINKIYIAKIKENKNQIAFQKMGSDISFEFLSLSQENFDEKVNCLLEKVGGFFNVDRTYLFTINHTNNTMTYSNEWCNTGINEEVGTIEEIPLDVFPWWIDQLKKKSLVYIPDVDFMPEEARAEQEQLHRQRVKSLVSVPVLGEGKVQAFIGMDSVLSTKEWTKENIEMLNILANILSSGMTQIEADKEIEFMAYYDNLTKLPNRFLFEDRVNQAIHLCQGTEKFISIMFIDLDNFKTVNDTIGHRGGDNLLKQVAKDLTRTIGKSDAAGRFGGDEFMVMINNITDYNTIVNMADKIMGIFADLFIVDDQEFLITASAGIAVYPVDGQDSSTLAKNADMAMYEAKAKGKNQYVLCTKEIKDEMQKNIDLSNDLYHALERNQFVVYYQPQVDLSTNRIIGVEALLRWIHPRRGIISPRTFIPIAEESRLINSIGLWVLRTVCMQNKKWQDMGLPHLKTAVNLSGVQMINPKIVENIEGVIKEAGIDPKYIELEITESVAIQQSDYVIDVLNRLKKIGVSIAIDDFGTEYSSLSRLKILPIDRIKIDMQFTQGLESNEKDRAITMVIINLAKSLGLSVLAEGVETAPQLEFLNQKMCEYAQGFYYYKPMPAEEMEEILRKL